MTRARTSTIAEDPLGGTVRRTVLPNGLRVITEAVPAMRSVSFGVIRELVTMSERMFTASGRSASSTRA